MWQHGASLEMLINRIHYRNNRKAVISQIHYPNRVVRYILIYSADELQTARGWAKKWQQDARIDFYTADMLTTCTFSETIKKIRFFLCCWFSTVKFGDIFVILFRLSDFFFLCNFRWMIADVWLIYVDYNKLIVCKTCEIKCLLPPILNSNVFQINDSQ